jgi:hypothetical protein
MAGCNKIVGLKNLMFTFYDPETNTSTGPWAHELSKEELPQIRSYGYKLEPMTGGYQKKVRTNAHFDCNVIMLDFIPMSFYQGRACITVQAEYESGRIYTGSNGTVTGEEMSDSHDAPMKMLFDTLYERLPPGAVANT